MNMKMNMFFLTGWKIFGSICVMGLLLVAFTRVFARPSTAELQGQPLNLEVATLKQSRSTSCGEAVIAMTYNFADPNHPITEAEVIQYATINKYYIANRSPYTSPANMVKIAKYFTKNISTGRAFSSGQGLALLIQELRSGEPVIIDVLSNFHDPESEAHFIVITGISLDSNRENAIVIHYNDPLTSTKEASDWAGSEGLWNAWQTNNDPGGSGWWLVISRP